MCGIVGYVGPGAAVPFLLDGLSRLEYRGYDSAGLAVSRDGTMQAVKEVGRVLDLRTAVAAQLGESDGASASDDASVVTGIAHTRWATHGRPTQANAHPHLDQSGRIAVVHNGIVENADELRSALRDQGVQFASETDTEVIPHMVRAELDAGASSLVDAVSATLGRVQGTYGLVVMSADHPGELVVAANGSPVVLGIGDGAMFVSSDTSAFVRHTERVLHLEDGNIASVTADGYSIGSVIDSGAGFDVDAELAAQAGDELGDFEDYMRKEILEQPRALRRAVAGRLDPRNATVRFGGIEMDARTLRSFRRVKILGCGSAYYAGQMGAAVIEELARVPADAESAAEFRYRNPVVDPDTLYFAVSQSGETIDTLLAVQELQRKGCTVLGVVNKVGSAIARETGRGIFIHAGPEYSVASTKALTNMAASLAMVGVLLGRVRDLSESQGRRMVEGLERLPGLASLILAQEDAIAALAEQYCTARSMYFIGRSRGFPVAREAAQKLKEISYIHGEAYPASELKHGPLALIDETMPSVVLVPDDELFAKNVGTIEQIRARGGRVLAVAGSMLPDGIADDVIRVPSCEPELDPILFNLPLQMFAYYCAVCLGREVDKPRNLAKSVTVE